MKTLEYLLFLAVLMALSTSAYAKKTTVELSGELTEGLLTPSEPGNWPKIGMVADSQFQTTQVRSIDINWLRGKMADKVARVAIRPPALNWAARSMLKAHLKGLKAQGAAAIFYLGDGANSGCSDEFSDGFDETNHNSGSYNGGILAFLSKFRKDEAIPVYFILGNHDMLGAGSSSRNKIRNELCGHERARLDTDGKPDGTKINNPPLTKLDVIRLTDNFNKQNENFIEFSKDWNYNSSFDSTTESNCNRERRGQLVAEGQNRKWGCYLAATVGFNHGERKIEFLLLDTTDYVSVAKSGIGKYELEGLRGAMSFGDSLKGLKSPSQTNWFVKNTQSGVAMRIALSHYNISKLKFPGLKYSQQFSNIFTTTDDSRKPKQDAAFVVTGHTHTQELEKVRTGFKIRSLNKILWLNELNIGSTTDYSNHAALLELRPGSVGDKPAIGYVRLALDEAGCSRTYADIEKHTFSYPVRGETQGWKGIGIDARKRTNYRKFNDSDIRNVRLNLDAFAGEDPARAICIGLRASIIESKTKQRQIF